MNYNSSLEDKYVDDGYSDSGYTYNVVYNKPIKKVNLLKRIVLFLISIFKKVFKIQ